MLDRTAAARSGPQYFRSLLRQNPGAARVEQMKNLLRRRLQSFAASAKGEDFH